MKKSKKETFPYLLTYIITFYIIILLTQHLQLIPTQDQLLNSAIYNYQIQPTKTLITNIILESIVFIGLYAPGSSILIYTVTNAKQTTLTYLLISIITAIIITAVSILNYYIGRFLSDKIYDQELYNKGLLLSCLHPNILALYTLNAGIANKPPTELKLIPIYATMVGFIYTLIFSTIAPIIGHKVEQPIIIVAFLGIWVYTHRKKSRINPKSQIIKNPIKNKEK